MARSSYYTDPSRKHLEVYYDFSGGLNTVTSNDNLGDNELTRLVNMDLSERGSVKRRTGTVKHLDVPVVGEAQCYFRYFREGGTYEEIQAISGKLYRDGVLLTIDGLDQFQTERQIEAVQLGKILYIATGTKLVQYDGEVAKVVEPYAPDPLEALYIGTNALADDPDNFIRDGESANLRIDGVTVTMRYGAVNKPNTFEVFVSKPNGSVIEYKVNYRKKDSETWITGQEFSESRTYEFIPDSVGEYEFDFYARVKGQTDQTKYARYILPTYTVKEVEEEQIDASTIHNCTRILLHWNRLVLYGDIEHPEAIYISQINRGDYFPIPNSLNFANERREGITSLVQYRNILVVFTPTTIQALFGKGPSDFTREMLNTSIGCIAPYSAKVIGNHVAFLSREGVYVLKSLAYSSDMANVEKVDMKIENIVPRDENACAVSYGGQYQLTFPNSKKRFRMYFNLRNQPWTTDESEKMDFIRYYDYDGILYAQSKNGQMFRFDDTVFTDDGYSYTDAIETKYFDFGQPYNIKKLKELQIMIGHEEENVNSLLWLYADSAKSLNPDASYASVDENGNVVWNVVESPNIEVLPGTAFGSWKLGESTFGIQKSTVKKLRISGKCRRTKIYMEHREPVENQLLGLAFVFKTKKP